MVAHRPVWFVSSLLYKAAGALHSIPFHSTPLLKNHGRPAVVHLRPGPGGAGAWYSCRLSMHVAFTLRHLGKLGCGGRNEKEE